MGDSYPDFPFVWRITLHFVPAAGIHQASSSAAARYFREGHPALAGTEAGNAGSTAAGKPLRRGPGGLPLRDAGYPVYEKQLLNI